jgi:hypothetical protein
VLRKVWLCKNQRGVRVAIANDVNFYIDTYSNNTSGLLILLLYKQCYISYSRDCHATAKRWNSMYTTGDVVTLLKKSSLLQWRGLARSLASRRSYTCAYGKGLDFSWRRRRRHVRPLLTLPPRIRRVFWPLIYSSSWQTRSMYPAFIIVAWWNVRTISGGVLWFPFY